MTDILLPPSVTAVMRCLEQAGFAVYAVGGAVRDALAGKAPHDYDLCTAAAPEQVCRACSAYSVIETGLRHGTVTVLSHGMPIEVTTFRTEGAYTDFRRPDSVRFVTDVRLDLARRDFTVNAMAYHPAQGVLDPFGGQADLKAGILRCVGNPDQRFCEDALRILRALRFVAEWGWTMDAETARAVHAHAGRLAHISAERITAELLRMLCGAHVGRVLMEFSDVFACILPEIKPMIGFDQHNHHHKYTVWEHSVRAVEGIRPDPVLRLTMLLHDIGKPACFSLDDNGVGHFYGHPTASRVLAQQALCRLRLPSQMEDTVLYLVRHHDTPLGTSVRQVRRKLAVHGETRFRALLAIKKADCIGQGTAPHNLTELLAISALLRRTLEQADCITRRDLALNGRDLMALGIHGRAIGMYLSALLSRVLDNPSFNTREQLLRMLDDLRQGSDRMEMTINGMSAAHCMREVRTLIERQPGVRQADIDLPSGRVTIWGKDIPMDEIRRVLTAAGYEVVL